MAADKGESEPRVQPGRVSADARAALQRIPDRGVTRASKGMIAAWLIALRITFKERDYYVFVGVLVVGLIPLVVLSALFGGCAYLIAQDGQRTLRERTADSSASRPSPLPPEACCPAEPDLPDFSGLETAYSEGFAEACSDVWSNSRDGALYYDDEPYTEDDCLAAEDATVADGLSDPDEAADQGRLDGYDAAFSLTEVLCWGTDCYTRSDF